MSVSNCPSQGTPSAVTSISLTDRIAGAPSLEQRMDDVRAVMDEIGSQRAVLLRVSERCPMSALFAATYPERILSAYLNSFCLAASHDLLI